MDATNTSTENLALSNSLTVLAARIRAEHEAVRGLLHAVVERAMAAGDLLIEAKAQVPHGQWLPWLQDHVQISERTAQLYMRLAKNRAEIEKAKSAMHVADLTLNQAAAVLTLSSNIEKLFDFIKQLERLSDPEEIMQLCLDSGVAQLGTIDYESDYSVEQRREWDLFILFMVRHIRWPSDYADDHVCWLKRRNYNSASEWMGEVGDKDRRKYGVSKGGWMPEPSDQAKKWWNDLLLETKNLDRLAINKLIGEEDKVLRAEIDGAKKNPAEIATEAHRIQSARNKHKEESAAQTR
jgi:hypothetical protein